MKDAVELVRDFGLLGSPWAVAAALVLTAPLVFKVLLEIASMSHATREKRLGLLLKYIDAGLSNSPRFSVEQAFRHNYGVLVDFAILERLWEHVASSAHVQNYLWGRRFLRFDTQTRRFSFLKDYNWKARTTFLVGVFGVAYAVAAVSFVASLVLLSAGAWDGALKGVLLSGVMSAGIAVVITSARASRAARDVVEQQDNIVSCRCVSSHASEPGY